MKGDGVKEDVGAGAIGVALLVVLYRIHVRLVVL